MKGLAATLLILGMAFMLVVGIYYAYSLQVCHNASPEAYAKMDCGRGVF